MPVARKLISVIFSAITACSILQGQSFQYSVAQPLRLGIRDKFGELGGYQANFIVKGPRGIIVKKEIKVEGDSWGYVVFPDDFEIPYMPPGEYSWEGIVKGKKVVSGKFEKIGSYILKIIP